VRRTLLVAVLVALVAPGVAAAKPSRLDRIRNIVVIYEENHSFDNLYGGWPKVDGVGHAPKARTTQVDQAGAPYACLQQKDVNLAARGCGAFPNRPFRIDRFIPATATTCPAPGQSAPDGVMNGSGRPGGCTRDLVHRYYQEQYQLNEGAQNRYVTGSDALGLTMGVYDTKALPIYRYLHRKRAPRYVIADRFFQAAFGGSFLNHQWLVAARTPTWPGAPADQHSLVDANGMPTSYPLYTATGPTADRPLTVACPGPAGVTCGDFAVNTIQPPYEPHGGGAQLPPQTHKTIGDRLSAKRISWAWYSGGWSNADGDVGAPGWTNGDGPACSDPDATGGATFPHCPDKLFQYHHQPLNYFKAYAPGTKARTRHLRDEQELIRLARASKRTCKLRRVSFVKPIGAENEHPGYASVAHGSDHLVALLKALRSRGCRGRTMIVVTYDEFGGQWDHVPPPGQGSATPGPHDAMGPGTRIPALVIAPGLHKRFAVDHASHDTTSILATIERRFRLKRLTSRDRAVRDLATALR
jgi:acid phosphatase